jgi:hypothetical protein
MDDTRKLDNILGAIIETATNIRDIGYDFGDYDAPVMVLTVLVEKLNEELDRHADDDAETTVDEG